MALDLGTLVGHVDLDTRDYDSKYRQVRSAWSALGQQAPADLRVRADIQSALADVDRARAALREFDGESADAQVQADVAAAVADLERAEGVLRALDGDSATVEATADVARATTGLGEVEAGVRRLNGERATVEVDADTSRAEGELDAFSGSAESAGGEGGRGFMTGIIAGIAAIPIAGALVKVGQGMVESIMDGFQIDAQRDLFGARTGLDEATSAKFGRAAGNAYANNWGASVEENLDAARSALANGLIDASATEADTRRVVEQLQAVAQVLDTDIPTAARAAGNMLKNDLVRDVEGATDLMIAAQQHGVNASEDFFDTFIEYAGNFKQAGIDGELALGLMVQAMEDGVYNTDVLGDTIKEFGLRAREGTEPVAEAFRDLGLDAGDMQAKMTEGGTAAREAFGLVLDRLRELQEQGVPTQEIITNLFGGPGENLGPALFALDLDAAALSMQGLAGTTESAMTRIGDNTSSQMEAARRNVEVAMDGVKGALAAAFGEDIDAAAQWVQRNRGPLMEFILNAANGAFDLGVAFIETFANAQRSVGEFLQGALTQLLYGLADAAQGLDAITPGDQGALSQGLEEAAAAAHETGMNMRGAADVMETEWTAGLNGVRDRMNEWAGPEIMSAHLHDVTVVAAERMAEVEDIVAGTDAAFTINGDAANADRVLAETVEAIENSDGTVTVNGSTVPAEEALDEVLALVQRGESAITVKAATVPASEALATLLSAVAQGEETVTINGETVNAEDALEDLMADVRDSGEEVTIGGRKVPAERAIRETLAAIRNGSANVTIGGRTSPASDATAALLRWVQDRRANVKTGADTSWARVDVLNWRAPFRTIPLGADLSSAAATVRNWRPRATVGITGVMMQASGGPVVGLAGGGEVNGPGPRGVDSVPAGPAFGGPVTHVLAPNEHVWTSGEVDAMGGHGVMLSMRRMARDGTLRALLSGAVPLADGGPVGAYQDGAVSAAVARLTPETEALLRAVASRPIQIGRRVLVEAMAESAEYGATRGLRRL